MEQGISRETFCVIDRAQVHRDHSACSRRCGHPGRAHGRYALPRHDSGIGLVVHVALLRSGKDRSRWGSVPASRRRTMRKGAISEQLLDTIGWTNCGGKKNRYCREVERRMNVKSW